MLRKRGTKWYFQTKVKGRKVQVCTGQTDRRKAEALVEQLKASVQLRAEPCGVSKRLKEAIVREVHRIETDIGARRAARQSYALENFAAWAKNPKLEDITKNTLLSYQRHRIQTAARDTVHRELSAVRKLLSENGFKVENPGVPLSGRCNRNRAFTRAEVEAIGKHTPERYRTLYATLLATGARLAELVPSRRSNHVPLLKSEVDLEAGTLRIRTAKCKAGSRSEERIVIIPQEIVEPLRHQIATTPGPHVFPRSVNLCHSFDKVLKAAGIPKIDALGDKATLHSFRHTYGTLAAEAVGSNQFLVQKMLGHKQISTTARYCHPTAPELQNNPVSALVGGEGGCQEGCQIVEVDFRKAV